MFRYTLAVLVAGLFLAPLSAGEYNKKVSLGDAAPNFSKLPAADGKEYGLDSFKDKEVFVIVITCNKCPVAVDYQDRIIAFTKKYAGEKGKVGIIAVNVNLAEEDLLPKMKERAKEKGFNFPYAIDESQKIGRELGASHTPEFYVYNKDRKLVYMGAMDDDQKNPKVNYLEAAVEATLKGEKVSTSETRARGCGIGYTK
jgi:peroxiredoxin